MDRTTISKIYTSRTILLDILEENGYDTTEYNEFGISHVAVMIENNQLNLLLHKRDSSKKIYIKYFIQDKMSPSQIRNMADEFFVDSDTLNKEDDLMIIVKDDPNESTTEMLDTLWSDEKIFISMVNLKRLQFNILKHVQVPKHRILSKEEEVSFIEKYNIKSLADLPVISRYDPVAIMIGLRPSMICHIERKSKTSIITNYYRVCV